VELRREDDVPLACRAMAELAAVRAGHGDDVAGLDLWKPQLSAALEARVATRVSTFHRDCRPLLECSFAFGDEGARLFRLTRDGELGWLANPAIDIRGAEVHGGWLLDAIPERTPIEVHWPVLDRKEHAARTELVPTLCMEATADGRLVGRLPHQDAEPAVNFHQAALTLASSQWMRNTEGTAQYTLGHEQRWTGPGTEIQTAVGPLLASYGIPSIAGEMGNETADVTLGLTLKAEAAASWLGAPEEQGLEFFELLSNVSLAVQASLRRWIPARRLPDMDLLRDSASGLAMIVYQASRPHVGRYRGEYVRDVIDPSTLGCVIQSARGRTSAGLASAARRLKAAGFEEEAADYSTSRARALISKSPRVARRIRALLSAEAQIIEVLVRLAAEIRGGSGRARKIRRRADELVRALQAPLRRLNCAGLASLVLLEATAALCEALGGRPEVHVVARSGGWTLTGTGGAR
ncbi:MAG: hypothetical protein ACRD44_10975, partial [Bryobacteraceae bacterium]